MRISSRKLLSLAIPFCVVVVHGADASPTNAATVPVATELGPLETVAGAGELGHSGDGGLAVDAKLHEIQGITVGDAGNLIIAEGEDFASGPQYVRAVAPDGTISTLAGGPIADAEEFEDRTTSDGLQGVGGLAAGPEGEVYVADGLVGKVMRIDPDGEVAVFAGTGEHGHAGDGGPATEAALGSPAGVAVGDDGEVYVADAGGYIRRIGVDGVITTIAGTGGDDASTGDGGPATEASFTRPFDVEVDDAGNVYVADVFRAQGSDDDIPSQRIRRIDTDGVITTIAGGETCGFTGDGGPAAEAELCFPRALAVDGDGTIYLADPEHHQIRMITPDGNIDTLPIYVKDPTALAIGPDRALYIGDGEEGQVHRVPRDSSAPENPAETPAELADLWADSEPHVVAPVVGTGTEGSSGDGAPGSDAELSDPSDLAIGPDGTLYVLDSGNDRVRAVDPNGTVATVAGGGPEMGDSVRGPSPGDGRLATEIGLSDARGIDVGADGSLFIATRHEVRKVAPSGIITTAADSVEPLWDDGDDDVRGYGPFGWAEDVAVAPDGSLYVSDSSVHQVFHVRLDGSIEVTAGTGTAGFAGDGGPAADAELETPTRIDVGPDGELYIADDNRIRVVNTDGVISTIAGKESRGREGPETGAPATEVFLVVSDIAVDDAGTVYVGSTGWIHAIGADGIITRLTETEATAMYGTAVAVETDGSGNLYFRQDSHQISVLPRVDEEPAASSPSPTQAAASGGWSGVMWALIAGAVLVVVALAGYMYFRRATTPE